MSQHVGILGGGQLAMFLCSAADSLGYKTTVLAHSADSPAAMTAGSVLSGDLDDVDLVEELISRTDVITFDLEAIPSSTITLLDEAIARGDVAVHPDSNVLRTLQDKLVQKQWMVDNGLPTAPFVGVEGDHAMLGIARSFGVPLVQKARQGGYDGRGVQILHDEASLEHLWPIPSLVEEFVTDARELAVVAARGHTGEIVAYEPVEIFFHPEHNVLETVEAPAILPGALRDRAIEIAEATLTALGGVGLFAIELFLADGELLINEISPRVHNAGHHTLESAATSQFEQHLRAVCGLPLGPPTQARPAVMRNLLWQHDSRRLEGTELESIAACHDASLHWYGKRDARPWRKMGHITALGDSTASALQTADQTEQLVERAFAP